MAVTGPDLGEIAYEAYKAVLESEPRDPPRRLRVFRQLPARRREAWKAAGLAAVAAWVSGEAVLWRTTWASSILTWAASRSC